MNKKHVGFLHPGAMGISLAATAQNTGHTAYWCQRTGALTHTTALKSITWLKHELSRNYARGVL